MTVLLFIITIILFLGVDVVLQRKSKASPAPLTERRPIADHLRAPSGIFFAPSHTWLSLFPSGSVRLGVDDIVLRMMEKPNVVFLKKSGSEAKKGEPIMQLKEGDRTLTVRSPIDGDIVELNEEMRNHPKLMKESLFNAGWAYTMKPRRISELTHMIFGENTHAWVQQEFGRLRDFIAASSHTGSLAPVLMQDGGMHVEGALKHLSAKQCQEFEQEFLTVL